MPCWYFDKKDLRDNPSVRDGIPLETERRYRREGARFIMTCGTQMGLGHNTMATGVVYFHRFYMFHSFKSFPRYVTACCCLLLAGKVEETPKKCRDIIMTARQLLSDNHFYSFGKEPKEEVVTLERILLQTIKFDLQVEHPYTFLLKYAKCFKGDQQKLQKMVQMAWNFVNDSLSTVVCLQWEPEIIAVALIHLASKLSKFTLTDWVGRQPQHVRWWDMFVQDVTMDILEDICHQVLDLYQSNPKEPAESNSPPQKPPSRADSPTPLKSSSASSHTGSPVSKHKNVIPSTSNNSNAAVESINNVQTIKSLATTATSVPMMAVTTTDHVPNATTAAAPGYHHVHHPAHAQMYSAPPLMSSHMMHPMYGTGAPPPPGVSYPHGVSGGTTTVPPPLPPPPLAPYGAPPSYGPRYANTIASMPGTSTLGVGVAPPPPPGVSYPPPPPNTYVTSSGRQRY
uniref:Cyclin-K n=1 Tax=Glossina pallidipes TaxID=7398 RepID=A0A1A9Z5R4_GLOPL